jgi:hypothetical protein
MLKMFFLVLFVLAALGFAFAISAPADAKEQKQGSSKSVHVNKTVNVKRNVRVNRTVNQNIRVNRTVNRTVRSGSGKFVVGQKYNGHIWFGHNRHHWHGRWYAYGEGPCWINDDGEWFWNELVCPF